MISANQVDIIKSVIQPYGPKLLGIFGSYARGEADQNSDLDILIDCSKKINLLEVIALEQKLSELLSLRIDLVTLRSVHPSLLKHIEADLIRLV